jgi:archaellum component FlaC
MSIGPSPAERLSELENRLAFITKMQTGWKLVLYQEKEKIKKLEERVEALEKITLTHGEKP